MKKGPHHALALNRLTKNHCRGPPPLSCITPGAQLVRVLPYACAAPDHGAENVCAVTRSGRVCWALRFYRLSWGDDYRPFKMDVDITDSSLNKINPL